MSTPDPRAPSVAHGRAVSSRLRARARALTGLSAWTAATWVAAAWIAAACGTLPVLRGDEVGLRAGAAEVDITPPPGLPMWGYGGRKDIPARATRDALEASVVVLETGDDRLAIVGLDLGRGPSRRSMARLRSAAREKAGVGDLLLVGSHTHHGPCPELDDVEPTASWVATFEAKLVEAIALAAERCAPARVAVVAAASDRNRNRHSRVAPVPVDRTLGVLRLVGADDETIATLVNFAAHPTTLPAAMLEWSADWPGAMRRHVEEELGGVCVYLQGACGDMSCERRGLDTDAFGVAVGRDVVRAIGAAETRELDAPRLRTRREEFDFGMRVDLTDPVTYFLYCAAFFKSLVDAYVEEYEGGRVRPEVSVAVLDDRIAFVAASGELFSAHAIRLRERARIDHLFVLGCANGYHQYFPTIEAVFEGGYGADPEVAPAEVGAGERMMDWALRQLYELRTAPDESEREAPSSDEAERAAERSTETEDG